MTTTLHNRIVDAVGRTTYKNLAELTQTNPESVRRYMTGQAPSVEFLSGLCRSMGVSGHWLLTGRGPMRESEMTQEALRQAKASDLLGAMADTIQRLVERVESLERYVQQIDTRVRARATPMAAAPTDSGKAHEFQPPPPRLQEEPAVTARTTVSFVGHTDAARGGAAQRTSADAR